MSNEKRLVLFFVLAVVMMWGTQALMGRLGLLPKRPEVAQVEAPKPEPAKPEAEGEKPAAKPGEPPNANPEIKPAPEAKVALARPAELVLGSATDRTAGGYRLEVLLDQRGAGVAAIQSSRQEAEFAEGKPRNRPLELIRPDLDSAAPPSFALDVSRPLAREDAGPDVLSLPERKSILPFERLWELARDEQGRAVRPVTGINQKKQRVEGQEIVFKTTVGGEKPVEVTRLYRLLKDDDAVEMELSFASPAGDQAVVYEMMGPHGIPIEGEWYTGTFRDVFFGGVTGAKSNQVLTISAADVVKRQDNPERYTSLPLAFAGVENQYFTVFAEPVPRPETLEQSLIKEGVPVVVHEKTDARQKSDVTVKLDSKPLAIGPNRPVQHTYRIYAGPKSFDALEPLVASELSVYRKGWSLWVVGDMGASFMAQNLIGPLLGRMYGLTRAVGSVFGGTRGNYGVAIILLTMAVRLILFPLGRKQARAAKKMQDLQPYLNELKEKYKDDKEAMAREQFALFRKHGVNPMGGCLLLFIQLPVLVGLWQALNNSLALRHSGFLWIKNLAAPDMLFRFPDFVPKLPLVGGALGPYFNLLPLVVVALMLIQTKLFSPPATTPEAESQQKMMKFMMLFMMFMFYKVPAGLSLYLITSSLWQIGERLLLPKTSLIAAKPAAAAPGDRDQSPPAASRPRPSGPDGGGTSGGGGGGWLSDLRDRAQQILEEAEKQRTVRNPGERRDRNRPRPGPGRKR
jgi:YidC/Oxa1 family membrane protein insertase